MLRSQRRSYDLERTKSLPPESPEFESLKGQLTSASGKMGKKARPASLRLEGLTWDKHGYGDYLASTPRTFGTLPRSGTLPSKPKSFMARHLHSAPPSPSPSLGPRCRSRNLTRSSTTPPSGTAPWCKEEEEDGAVYTCYLRKVRYRSSQGSSPDNDELSFKLWETVKIRLIKGGTLKKLIEHLTPSSPTVSEEDPGFFMTFLCTYLTFASAEEVLDLLIERYKKLKNKHTDNGKCDEGAVYAQRRMCSVLSVWLDQYASDFDEPPYYTGLHKIIKFAREDAQRNQGKDICQKAEKILSGLTVSPFDSVDPFKLTFCKCNSDNILMCICDKLEVLKDKEDICLCSFSTSLVAEQLTLVDSKLFRRVIPRQCLATFWSKREKRKGGQAPTIEATVDHFNAISRRVTATILEAAGGKSNLKDQQARVKVLRWWIEIAQECRNIKNFSSLKAILSALQCVAIHRLKKTWGLLSKETHTLYEQISEIFSDDLNQKSSRDLLMLEGTAKYATIDGRTGRKTMKKRQSWIKEGIVQGTVPYLGTFLTDLTMVDSALPDKLKNGLVNFEKRRKEFETIAQIKLLQEAAKNYSILADSEFQAWFYSLTTSSDNESYKASCCLEPYNPSATPEPPTRRQDFLRKHASVPDLLSKVLEEERLAKKDRIPKFASLLRRNVSMKSTASHSSDTSSSPSMTPPGSPASSPTCPVVETSPFAEISPCSQEPLNNLLPVDKRSLQPQGQIVKVTIEGTDQTHVYKSILLSSNDRTHDIIRKSLEKYDISGSPGEYTLHQIIPGSRELNIPFNTNVYYAVNKNTELRFKLSRKDTHSNHQKSLEKKRYQFYTDDL